ncbi:hypothetical protein NP233_g9314 [Leucocoprinus birnbaumii]|uniref:Uncharacterized protein n=1 Tax=Leucocoprinus birnbaumii TaxID=56174 RepID=A0AAD5VMC6_9AGAR|nr:hypothetical protein NP233_g9314 [Leucocoprinus birnbaumii]
MEDSPTKVVHDHHFINSDSSQDEAPDSNSPSDYDTLNADSDSRRRAVSQGSLRRRKNKSISKPVDHEPHRHSFNHSDHGPSKEISKRAWYEFDFVVVLALISPVGNWLTGGDHIKNLLFVALLIFYLHQIIEVPWELYQKARQRTRPPDLSPSTSEDRYRELAISELRKFELSCLALTAISPFIGASILRYATHHVLGPDSISWFSTGLFVMATGVRPWSHIMDRINQRTEDLHTFIHYPPSSPNHKSASELQENVDLLLDRVDKIERSLIVMKDRLKLTSEDIFDHVDDALASIRNSLQKRQKKWDEQEERFLSMEKSVASLTESASGARSSMMMIPKMTITTAQFILEQFLPSKSPSAQRETGGGRTRYRPRRAPRLSTNSSALLGRLETIQEEGYDGSTSPLKRPLGITVGLLSGFCDVMLAPLRLAIRIIFGWQ